jgi:hypothetical protein
VLQSLREMGGFLRRLPTSFRVMMVRASVANFVVNMNPYNSIYVFALGASGTELGLLTSIGLALTAISALLTGWLTGGTRRGSSSRGLLPGSWCP